MEWLVLVSGLVLSVISAPAPQQDTKEQLTFAKEFMSRFGYLETGDSASESLIRVEQAIKDVQRFGGIPETGILDNSTIQLMKSPRCGLPDVLPANSKRVKRYELASPTGWTKRHISYFIANWSPKIGPAAMRSEMQKALAAWAKYSKLRFQEVTSPDADIIVLFGRDYHGDSYPFDGPGSILAHAFFPGEEGSFGGDIHFDDDEPWKINPGPFEDGVDFFTVAVHEIGHSLGLHHSPADGSVMNPYYKRYDSQTFSLGYDDILAMYDLYITKPPEGNYQSSDEYDNRSDDGSTKRKASTTTSQPWSTKTTTTTHSPIQTTTWLPHVTYVGDDETVDTHKEHDPFHGVPDPVEPLTPEPPVTATTKKSSSDIPDACEGHYSAVSYFRGELFVFKDNFMWRLSRPGQVMSGYPVTIHRMFNNLPKSLQRIDAVYERDSDSNIVFFSGDQYWVYNGNDIVDGSPKPLSDYGLPSSVKKIDAVMVFAKNRKTYIFSGDDYWRFDDATHTMDQGYPKSIQMFRGVPSNLDSAMTWSDGVTYFFKNDLYWAFNSTWLKTEPFYPQKASQYWMGCQ